MKCINFVVVVTILLFSSCENFLKWKPAKLQLEKLNYTGNELRIDGYYYEEIENPEVGLYSQAYFFYHDGVVLNTAGTYIDSEYQVIDSFSNSYRRSHWGLFNIDNNIIKIEHWAVHELNGWPTYIREGEILNDTTFTITESYRLKRGKKKDREEVNWVYHFKQFSPKPDSTNNFVK